MCAGGVVTCRGVLSPRQLVSERSHATVNGLIALTGIVAQIAREGVSILVVEQFARTVLGVADYAAIMVHGRIARVGRPDELEAELSTAYLGA